MPGHLFPEILLLVVVRCYRDQLHVVQIFARFTPNLIKQRAPGRERGPPSSDLLLHTHGGRRSAKESIGNILLPSDKIHLLIIINKPERYWSTRNDCSFPWNEMLTTTGATMRIGIKDWVGACDCDNGPYRISPWSSQRTINDSFRNSC